MFYQMLIINSRDFFETQIMKDFQIIPRKPVLFVDKCVNFLIRLSSQMNSA